MFVSAQYWRFFSVKCNYSLPIIADAPIYSLQYLTNDRFLYYSVVQRFLWGLARISKLRVHSISTSAEYSEGVRFQSDSIEVGQRCVCLCSPGDQQWSKQALLKGIFAIFRLMRRNINFEAGGGWGEAKERTLVGSVSCIYSPVDGLLTFLCKLQSIKYHLIIRSLLYSNESNVIRNSVWVR